MAGLLAWGAWRCFLEALAAASLHPNGQLAFPWFFRGAGRGRQVREALGQSLASPPPDLPPRSLLLDNPGRPSRPPLEDGVQPEAEIRAAAVSRPCGEAGGGRVSERLGAPAAEPDCPAPVLAPPRPCWVTWGEGIL